MSPYREPVRSLDGLRVAIGEGATLAWAVACARDGDPVPALWAACEEPTSMALLLVAAGRWTHDMEVAWARNGLGHRGGAYAASGAWRAAQLAMLRAAVPTLTLAEVVAGAARRSA